ncbi:outer membrane beta-barrel family protein [Pontibacter ruber]|uniref:TonB-dependent receptor domain-containing protein n=1 Tax=Pontibacter ruber TaxID=1343895 RepID=A0ABW5CX53_9BACT|nr:outer membrane beta-barrel family protein [Pontibacter ruber]
MIAYYCRIYTLLLLFLTSTSLLQAQAQQGATSSGKITGTLQEAESKKPVGFANVVLLSARDSSLVTGATSDIEGKFILERVPAGQFILRISMVGYPTRFVPNISITPTAPEARLGIISLKAASTRLGEVQVTAERPVVEYELDKRVVNVARDVNAQSGTVAEVMQNVPSVTVDVDGNVSLRGSSNVTILVDGKRSSLANLSLDQIPANLIENIEIITNPSSKYDPEGTSGVINLILKKDKKPGFNGSATVNAGTYDNYNTSLNLNYRYFKWSVNGGYDFRHSTRPGWNSSSTTYFGDTLSYLEQNGERDNKDISHNFRLGADYFLTPKHTLSASALYRTDNEKGNNSIFYRFLDENRQLTRSSNRLTEDSEDGYNVDLTLGYRQTFERKGQELTADLIFTDNVDDEESLFTEYEMIGAAPAQVQNSITDDKNRRLVAQADFVRPISESSSFETGFRSSLQRLDEDARFFDLRNSTGEFVYNDIISNHFVYDEQVHAAYANYSNKFKSISYQLGLRAEQTFTTSDQRTSNQVFRNDYFSLFPSLFVTQEINKDNKVQFSYSRRINRPRSRFLNPFVDLSDKYNVDYGNPELMPEFINSLELGYLRYWGSSSLNVSTFYRHTMDQIQRLRTTADVTDENGENFIRTETTFINLSDGTSYGVELAATHEPTKWWRLNGGVSGFRTELSDTQGDTELSNSQLSWNAKLNSTMTVWKNMDIQLSGNYRAPMASIQGRMEEMYSADLGIKKDVLKKKGTVLFRVSDIFNTREFNFLSYDDDFRTVSNNKRQSRIFYIGFTYRLNSEDSSRNRERRRQNEEDGGMEEEGF